MYLLYEYDLKSLFQKSFFSLFYSCLNKTFVLKFMIYDLIVSKRLGTLSVIFNHHLIQYGLQSIRTC